MGVVPSPIFVMSGFSEFNENSAVHMRDISSGQRTVRVSEEAETVIGPGWTPEMSAGTVAATLRIGMKKIRDRTRFNSETHPNPPKPRGWRRAVEDVLHLVPARQSHGEQITAFLLPSSPMPDCAAACIF